MQFRWGKTYARLEQRRGFWVGTETLGNSVLCGIIRRLDHNIWRECLARTRLLGYWICRDCRCSSLRLDPTLSTQMLLSFLLSAQVTAAFAPHQTQLSSFRFQRQSSISPSSCSNSNWRFHSRCSATFLALRFAISTSLISRLLDDCKFVILVSFPRVADSTIACVE